MIDGTINKDMYTLCLVITVQMITWVLEAGIESEIFLWPTFGSSDRREDISRTALTLALLIAPRSQWITAFQHGCRRRLYVEVHARIRSSS